MTEHVLKPTPLTANGFSEFGDVIESRADSAASMNDERFSRFDQLARVEFEKAENGAAAISIAISKQATAFPYRFDTVERHPLGSQAFVPLTPFAFVVVVARPGAPPNAAELVAFVTNSQQGVNYHRGVWHMPLIAQKAGQRFLVVDRAGGGGNCEHHILGETVTLVAPDEAA